MSRVLARAYSSAAPGGKAPLFPPPVSSLASLARLESKHAAAHPAIFARMRAFYRGVPKAGDAARPAYVPRTLLQRYYSKHFVERSSPAPVLHFIAGMMLVGYVINVSQGHHHPNQEFH